MSDQTRRRTRRSLLLVIPLAIAAVFASFAISQAASTCTYNAGTQTVLIDFNAVGDDATVRVSAGNIQVSHEGGPFGNCSVATVGNTNTISVVDDGPAGGFDDTDFTIDLTGGPFVPGNTNELGSSDEIEFEVNLGAPGAGASEDFAIVGSNGVEIITFGTSGVVNDFINLNANEADGIDPDVSFTSPNFADTYTVFANGGDDVIKAQGGDGTGAVMLGFVDFRGGDGNDTLFGSDSGIGDTLDGGIAGAGADGFTNNTDTISGFGGSDTIFAANNPGVADTFNSGTINGGIGADTLIGFEGSNTLNGDAGSDTIDGGAGHDLIDGGPGSDSDGGAGCDGGVELRGGSGQDIIKGSAGDDLLCGGLGNDVLRGEAGNDVENGEAGDDRYDQGATPDGHDTISTNAGTDTGQDTLDYSASVADVSISLDNTANDGRLVAGETADNILGDVEVFKGGEGNDTISGDADNETYIGNGGNDTFNGGLGNDTLRGGLGNDIENGDGADDTFDQEADDNGGDTLNGGTGTGDTVVYSARTTCIVADNDNVVGDDGEDADCNGVDEENDTITNSVERIDGGTNSDTLACFGAGCTVNGGPGNDNLSATGGATANGGPGNDTLGTSCAGGAGGETLNGDSGADRFVQCPTANGGQILNGGTGFDTVDYSQRASTVVVDIGAGGANDGEAAEGDNVVADNESVIGGSGNDTLTGSGDAELLDGRLGNDTLNGGGGDDTLLGAHGDDNVTLNGGPGDDLLSGGPGDDVANGNAGNDVFLGTTQQSFASTNVPLAIPDLTTITSTVVLGAGATIRDVDVRLDIEHTFDADLEVSLSHGTTSVLLINNRGGAGDHLLGTVFDDEASTAVSAGSAPFNGRFDGEQALAAFDGQDPSGIWTLTVSDQVGLDIGTLNAWSLDMTLESASADGNDVFNGGSETDLADYAGRSGNLTLINDGVDPVGPSLGNSGQAGETDRLATDVENLAGGSGADLLINQAAGGVSFGNNGNDIFRTDQTLAGVGDGTPAAQSLLGGLGDDTYQAHSANDGNDEFFGGSGGETNGDHADYSARNGAGNAVDLHNNGTATSGDTNDPETDAIFNDVEDLSGGDQDDTITNSSPAGAALATSNGNAGNDTFLSTTVSNGGQTLNGGTGTADHADYSARDGAGNAVNLHNDGLATSGDTTPVEGDAISLDVEVLSGGDQGDTITNGANGGVSNGNEGNDALFGLAGSQTLNGGTGNDTLDGGAGDDFENGDAGDDTFNQQRLPGLNGNDDISGGPGTDTINYPGATSALYLNSDGPGGDADGETTLGEADDIFGDFEILNGSPFNDTIMCSAIGPGPGSTLNGGAGNDRLVGCGTDDTLNGGTGNDVLEGHGGNDSNTLNGGDGNDRLFGDDDRFTSRPGSLVPNDLLGTAGNDALNGNAGDDYLDGGPGNDVETGGAGNDCFDQSNSSTGIPASTPCGNPAGAPDGGANGADVLNEAVGEGIDQVTYRNRASGVRVSLDGAANDGLGFAEGDNAAANIDNITGTDFQDVLSGSDLPNLIQGAGQEDSISGLGGNDFLDGGQFGGTGNDAADVIDGGDNDDNILGDDGDDTVNAGSGTDVVNGENGNDNLNGGPGNDTIQGESGSDTLTGGDGTDTLLGGDDNDTIFGGSDNDSLSGNAGADSLNGDDGNDTLNGGAGNDTENGGNGDDLLYQESQPNGADVLNGGPGTDDRVDYSDRDSAVHVARDGIANDGEDINTLNNIAGCPNGADCEDDNVGGDVERALTPNAKVFVPLNPLRILDTRNGTGTCTPGCLGPLGGNQTRIIDVTGQTGGVPENGASSVVLNVTITNPTQPSHLAVYPADQPRPNVSNLNFVPGQTIANLVKVPISLAPDAGKVTVYNFQGSTDVIFDVAGYYTDGTTILSSGRYTAVNPTRILDTRDGTGGIFTSIAPLGTITVNVAGVFGAVHPTGASAAAINVTAVDPQGEGHLTVYPAGTSEPLASNLNFPAGENRAHPNLAIVRLGDGGANEGKIRIKNGSPTGAVHVILDVAGWYNDSSISVDGGSFDPLVPARILDTRTPGNLVLGPNATRSFTVTGLGEIPTAGVAAVVMNVTAVDPTGPGHLTVFPTGSTEPIASNINFIAGPSRPNLVIVRVGTGGQVTVRNGSPTGSVHLIFDVAGWFASP